MIAPLLKRVAQRVRVCEVGPRDGLQNESVILPVEDKLQLVEMLADTGLSEIEVSSFVSPKRVPQLADADELFRRLPPSPGVRYSALVPNEVGLNRAIDAGVTAIAFFTAASESFTQRNIGMTIDESLRLFKSLMPLARRNGMHVRAYVSTAFHCPFEGLIDPDDLTPIICDLMLMEVDEVSIGDTIGHAVPDEVARLTETIAPDLPFHRAAYHFHDTRGAALANVLMALQYGISAFDSAVGGVGGCPFAPGAAGNLATEDLLMMIHGMGIQTGVDMYKVVEVARHLEAKLGRYLPGKVMRACEPTPQEGTE
jgi:hydroxymethylglutaryl-CoA lyase